MFRLPAWKFKALVPFASFYNRVQSAKLKFTSSPLLFQMNYGLDPRNLALYVSNILLNKKGINDKTIVEALLFCL